MQSLASSLTGNSKIRDLSKSQNFSYFRLSGSQTYMFLFISCLGHAIPTMVFTFHTSVFMMCVNAFLFGFFVGTFHTSANVLLLDIWRGRKSSPYMYTLHLFFGFGSFVTPIITQSFQPHSQFDSLVVSNITIFSTQIPTNYIWTVDTLYMIIGSMLALTAFGFLYYSLTEKKFEYTKLMEEEEIIEKMLTIGEEGSDPDIDTYHEEGMSLMTAKNRIILIFLMTIFNFFFAGLEGSFKNFIPAFGSSCSLHLSRQDGSSLSAIFFGTYTINRVFLIVGSMFASPTSDMWISLLLCAVSCVVLHRWGDNSKLGLQVGKIHFQSVHVNGAS